MIPNQLLQAQILNNKQISEVVQANPKYNQGSDGGVEHGPRDGSLAPMSSEKGKKRDSAIFENSMNLLFTPQ